MWTEGLVVPPIKIYERGKINEPVLQIIARNSRLSEHLRGDLDAEMGAARLGSQRIIAMAERYGVDALEAAFDSMIYNCAETIRRELLPKIRDGVYTWEDYVEDDGVEGPQMHAVRLTMTKTADKIVLDYTGTSKEAKGPNQLAGSIIPKANSHVSGWARYCARSPIRPNGQQKST